MVFITIDEVSKLLPLIRKYGTEAINAFMAYSRGQLPIEPYRTEKFYEALEEIKKTDWYFLENNFNEK